MKRSSVFFYKKSPLLPNPRTAATSLLLAHSTASNPRVNFPLLFPTNVQNEFPPPFLVLFSVTSMLGAIFALLPLLQLFLLPQRQASPPKQCKPSTSPFIHDFRDCSPLPSWDFTVSCRFVFTFLPFSQLRWDRWPFLPCHIFVKKCRFPPLPQRPFFN